MRSFHSWNSWRIHRNVEERSNKWDPAVHWSSAFVASESTLSFSVVHSGDTYMTWVLILNSFPFRLYYDHKEGYRSSVSNKHILKCLRVALKTSAYVPASLDAAKRTRPRIHDIVLKYFEVLAGCSTTMVLHHQLR